MNTTTPNLTMTTDQPLVLRALRKLICCLASFTMVAVSVLANPVVAQTTSELSDTEPPVIEMDQVEQGIAGQMQVFAVNVTDDQSLLAVLLFHRLSGEEKFNSVDMAALEGTDEFSVSIPSSADDVRDIEYFIQAEDTAGNRSIKGFTFDPLIRVMSAPTALAAVVDPETDTTNSSQPTTGITAEAAGIESDEDPTEGTTEPQQNVAAQEASGGRGRLIWGIVGLLAVAAVAVALSQDDDDDDSPNPITLNDNGGRALSIQW